MLADLMREMKNCACTDIGTTSAWGWNDQAELIVFSSGLVMAVRTSPGPTGDGWRVSRWDDLNDAKTPAFAISLPKGDVVRYVRDLASRFAANPASWPEPVGAA